ncbi:aggregation-promoting factor C-terminal-like domain-containing protein [Caballeronia grimmiae]|uniref:aggregation-promoting factor C-terminal-like domain-containing protein n=1 Tax=Caballeronia grimmiae TaxID=1071679 RepID=UPI0038B77E61
MTNAHGQSAQRAARHSHAHRPEKRGKREWKEKPVSTVPLQVQMALREAMRQEQIAEVDFDDLAWIMAQESAGIVDARNGGSTARGLFQLLPAQYSLNPHGEASFGNAVEECQGGIRYIYGRYHMASRARDFWKRHHWF